MPNPTVEEAEHALLAQIDLSEVVNRQLRDGMDPRAIMAGLAATGADLVRKVYGDTAVPTWFMQQACAAQAIFPDPDPA